MHETKGKHPPPRPPTPPRPSLCPPGPRLLHRRPPRPAFHGPLGPQAHRRRGPPPRRPGLLGPGAHALALPQHRGRRSVHRCRRRKQRARCVLPSRPPVYLYTTCMHACREGRGYTRYTLSRLTNDNKTHQSSSIPAPLPLLWALVLSCLALVGLGSALVVVPACPLLLDRLETQRPGEGKGG